MGETSNRRYPYPETSATPDVPRDVKALAEAVDTDMATLLPVGAIIAYGGTTAPAGWLLCDGQSFNEATYPLLKTLLGSTATPNLIDRFVKGSATRPATPTGGSKKIEPANLPEHTHGFTTSEAGADHHHGFSATTSASAANQTLDAHSLNQFSRSGTGWGIAPGSGPYPLSGATHTHTVSGATGTGSANHSHSGTTNNGPGTKADYEPQFYALLYIIKAA